MIRNVDCGKIITCKSDASRYPLIYSLDSPDFDPKLFVLGHKAQFPLIKPCADTINKIFNDVIQSHDKTNSKYIVSFYEDAEAELLFSRMCKDMLICAVLRLHPNNFEHEIKQNQILNKMSIFECSHLCTGLYLWVPPRNMHPYELKTYHELLRRRDKSLTDPLYHLSCSLVATGMVCGLAKKIKGKYVPDVYLGKDKVQYDKSRIKDIKMFWSDDTIKAYSLYMHEHDDNYVTQGALWYSMSKEDVGVCIASMKMLLDHENCCINRVSHNEQKVRQYYVTFVKSLISYVGNTIKDSGYDEVFKCYKDN